MDKAAVTRLQVDYRDMEQASAATQRLGQALAGLDKQELAGFRKMGETMKVVGTSSKDGSKKVAQLSETFRDDLGRTAVVTSKEVGGSFQAIGGSLQSVTEDGKKAFNQMADFEKALRRVALVVPVWMAARAVIQGVFGTIREGMSYIADMEKGMARAATMSHDLTDSQAQLGAMQEQTNMFMRETGRQFSELAEGYSMLKTAGMDYETAMSGQIPIIKTSVGLMSDVNKTARGMADLYNILGHTVTGAADKQEVFATMLGVSSKLFTENAFELQEFVAAMTRAAGVAETAGFSFQELAGMMGAMAQVGIRDAQAGTSLIRVLRFVSRQPNLIEDVIGVDPRQLRTVDVLERLFTRLRELVLSGQRGRAFQIADELFGARGIQFTALASAEGIDKLNRNLRETAQIGTSEAWNIINKNYEIQNNQLEVAQNRLQRVRGLMGEAFLQGITGSDSMTEAVNKLADGLESTVIWVDALARGTSWWLKVVTGLHTIDAIKLVDEIEHLEDVNRAYESLKDTFQDIDRAMKGEMSTDEVQKLLKFLEDSHTASALFRREWELTGRNIHRVFQDLQRLIDRPQDLMWDITTLEGQEQYIIQQIARLKERMPALEVDADVTPAERKLYELARTRALDGLFDQLNQVREQLLGIAESAPAEGVFTGMERSVENVLSNTEKLIQHRIQLLRIQGATTLEQIKAQKSLEEQYYGQARLQTVLNQQLETERLINDQKRLQYGYSTDTMKVFEVARKYGTDVAQEISRVLTTDATPDRLSDQALAVFRREFEQMYMQFRAHKFFTGGEGARFAIAERGLDLFDRGTPMLDAPGTMDPRIPTVSIHTPVSMAVSVHVSGDELVNQVERSIREHLRNPTNELTKQLKEMIENL